MLTCFLCKRAYPSSQQLISHLRGEHGYYPGPKFTVSYFVGSQAAGFSSKLMQVLGSTSVVFTAMLTKMIELQPLLVFLMTQFHLLWRTSLIPHIFLTVLPVFFQSLVLPVFQ